MEEIKNIDLADSLELIKKLTKEYDEAKHIVESLGKYIGFAHYYDYKLDLELNFKLGYYYLPNFSNTSKFDCKASSEILNKEIMNIIKQNIKDVAIQALVIIEKRLRGAEDEFNTLLIQKSQSLK